ncbi:MAG: WG repeat-containing protein [Leptospiraceae bacterium]|nr:WG repeat-containing protein [Leptospiraceae bacterium]
MQFFKNLLPGIFVFFLIQDLYAQTLYHIQENCTKAVLGGYADSKGKVRIKPGWRESYNFTADGFALVEGAYSPESLIDCEAFMFHGHNFSSTTDKYQYRFIRPNGKYLSQKAWGKAYPFHEGMAAVGRDAEMAMGFINTAGRLVIPEQWQEPGEFSNGFIRVELIDDAPLVKKWYIKDPAGKNLFSMDLTRIPRFNGTHFYYSVGDSSFFYDESGRQTAVLPFRVGDYHEGIAAAYSQKQKKGSYVNTAGKLITAMQYKAVEKFQNGLGLVKDFNGRFHFLDKDGQTVISNLDYHNVLPFADGMAMVSRQNGNAFGYGFIDKSGRLVIAAKYFQPNNFSEGLANVCTGPDYKNLKCGYINKSGQFLIQPRFQTAHPFHSGRAKVKLPGDRFYSFIDQRGNVVFTSEQYRDVSQFRDGALRVQNHKFRYSYVDADGKLLIDRFFDRASEFFQNGFGIVYDKSDGSGYLDNAGKFLFPMQKTTLEPFDESGIARVQNLTSANTTYAVAYIDKKAGILISSDNVQNITHLGLGHFAENTMGTPELRFVYLNKAGKRAFPEIFEYASVFRNGYAIVRQNKETYLMNTSGKLLRKLPWKHIELTAEKLMIIGEDQKRGLADYNGKVIVKPYYSYIENAAEGTYGVCIGRPPNLECGYIDEKGQKLFSRTFNAMPNPFADGMAHYKNETNQCGYYNKQGKNIIPADYTICTPFRHGLAWVKKNIEPYGSIGYLIDKSGSIVWKQTSWLEGWWEAPYTDDHFNRKVDRDNLDLKLLHSAIFAETNRSRRKHGIPAFLPSAALDQAASGHSRDMLRLGFYSHDSKVPGKKTVKDRFRKAGITNALWAENISRNSEGLTYGELARKTVWGWITSPGHRKNILRRELKYIGIGSAGSGRTIYHTQNFSDVKGP